MTSERKKDLYVAMVDRWAPDAMDLDYEQYKRFYELMFDPYLTDEIQRKEKIQKLNLDMTALNDRKRNTSVSDYVWLPLHFEGEMVYIDWLDEWKWEDFE